MEHGNEFDVGVVRAAIGRGGIGPGHQHATHQAHVLVEEDVYRGPALCKETLIPDRMQGIWPPKHCYYNWDEAIAGVIFLFVA